eukprot:m51a1_g13302 hypothetical protein (174) ;mRNA; r:1689-2210
MPGLMDCACSLAGSVWAAQTESLAWDRSRSRLCRWDPREPLWQVLCTEGMLYGPSMAACGGCLYCLGEELPAGGLGLPGSATAVTRCRRLDVRVPLAWQDVAPPRMAYSGCGLVCLEERQCLVAVGGYSRATPGELQSVELYAPGEDRWVMGPQLPMACQPIGCTTVAVHTFW